MRIEDKLIKLQDKKYAEFQRKIIPNIEENTIIGVRVPMIRKLSKSIEDPRDFLNTLPHKYYEENILHAVLVSDIKDYDKCIEALDKFLPYVDNWAVCDSISPIVFRNNKNKLINKIEEWSKSMDTYTCRFGIGMLMKHFLEGDFKKDYLIIPASIDSDEYYINMMIAWLFATALAKQWETTIPYLENKKLKIWVHNKTIQKSIESRRIPLKRKEYLRSLKV